MKMVMAGSNGVKTFSFRMLLISALGLLSIFSPNQAFSAPLSPSDQNASRMMVHLLDYLAQDYPGAVGPDGKVTSKSEYAEQTEFAELVQKSGDSITTPMPLSLKEDIKQLVYLIKKPAAPLVVTQLARKIKKNLIPFSQLQIAPPSWPELARGQAVYQKNCIVCHGTEGKGDGPGGKGLTPSPADFWKEERMRELSPFQAFNTIRLGVPGTGMLAFDQLNEEEIWNVAFYILSLRHQQQFPAEIPLEVSKFKENLLNLEGLSTKSDAEINGLLEESLKVKDDKKRALIISYVRSHPGEPRGPEGLATAASTGTPGKANGKKTQLCRDFIEKAHKHSHNGQWKEAREMAVYAYLQGIEPLEPVLKGKAPELVQEIETKMADWRRGLEDFQNNNITTKKLETIRDSLLIVLDKIDQALDERSSSVSPWVNFSFALSVVLREGFEAVLIILAIFGVVAATGLREAKKYIHAGWMAALGLGVVAWFASGTLIQHLDGVSRELIESFTSLLAVAILLYMGVWLHGKTEVKRWNAFIHQKTHRALSSGNLWGLATVSFVAVFREALETVLFLRSLWIEHGGEGKNMALLGGVATAFVLIAVLATLYQKFSQKISLKALFVFSSMMMFVLAVILTGKGIHSLQEVGYLPMTPFPLKLQWDTVGLYPTMESVISQVVIFVACMIFALFNKKELESPAEGK